jgi:hypothetical protein
VFIGMEGSCFFRNARMMSAINPKTKPNTTHITTERPLLWATNPQMTAITMPPMRKNDGLIVEEANNDNIRSPLAENVSDHTPRMTSMHPSEPKVPRLAKLFR